MQLLVEGLDARVHEHDGEARRDHHVIDVIDHHVDGCSDHDNARDIAADRASHRASDGASDRPRNGCAAVFGLVAGGRR